MTHLEALLHAVFENPDDDAPRLILADWLDENGDPERAEFIRVQVELARLTDGEPKAAALSRRASALSRPHVKSWLGEAGRFVNAWSFWRGLIRVIASAFTDLGELVDSLAATSAWPWIDGLTLYPRSAGALTRLLSSLHLGHLAELNLPLSGIGPDGALALARCPHLIRLRYLGLAENPLSAEGARALAESSLACLRGLNLRNAEITEEGVAALASSPRLAGLTSLALQKNSLGSHAARALAESPHLGNLTALWLSFNLIGPEGVAALAGSPRLTHLTAFDLSLNPVGAAGARALAESPHLTRLEYLNLRSCQITDEGISALASSPNMANVVSLDLRENPFGIDGARALVESPHLLRLASLGVGDTRIGDKGLKILMARFPYTVYI